MSVIVQDSVKYKYTRLLRSVINIKYMVYLSVKSASPPLHLTHPYGYSRGFRGD